MSARDIKPEACPRDCCCEVCADARAARELAALRVALPAMRAAFDGAEAWLFALEEEDA